MRICYFLDVPARNWDSWNYLNLKILPHQCSNYLCSFVELGFVELLFLSARQVLNYKNLIFSVGVSAYACLH